MNDFEYDDYKHLIEEHLTDFIPDVDQKSITLYDSMRYSVTAGGKRIRPVLLMAACDFCGGKSSEALPYACAIEYIHTFLYSQALIINQYLLILYQFFL